MMRVENDGIFLNVETFGTIGSPAVLLIMGATAQGMMWHDHFCVRLAENGMFVVRYDHRDTGKSSRVNYDQSPYYLSELTDDAIAILDQLHIPSAHVIGASMGSFIAQKMAIESPKRVRTLTCVMSSPNHLIFVDGFEGRDISHHELPATDPKMLEYYQAIMSVRTTSLEEDFNKPYVDILLDTMPVTSDMIEVRVSEGRILKRLKSSFHVHNHSYALAGSEDLHSELKKITHPTLVIHGRDDFILPVEHGRKLAKMIVNSKYIEYEGMGHCFSDVIFDRIISDFTTFIREASNGSNNS